MNHTIPFNRVSIGDEEKAAVLQALETGALGGNGAIGAQLQRVLRERLGVGHVLLTTSCSHALELAAMALDLQPGDEVIMPSFTFVTSASSMVRQGARPVFVDIDDKTFNINPAQIEPAITARTRAILPVHYAGQGCAMTAIKAIAQRHSLYVIEDAAQALGAAYLGQPLGAQGDIGCFSFHVTKNVVCGEGGAFATNNDQIAERAEIMREKGTNRSKFLRGQVDKYTWVDIGSSFVPSDLLAAVALAQINKMEKLHARRQVVWERYQEGLRGLADSGVISLPYVAPEAQINWHIYAFRVMEAQQRGRLLDELRRRGIEATFHYVPLHTSPYAMSRWGYRKGDLPVTESVSESLVRLPIYPDLSETDQDYIITSIYEILGARVLTSVSSQHRS